MTEEGARANWQWQDERTLDMTSDLRNCKFLTLKKGDKVWPLWNSLPVPTHRQDQVSIIRTNQYSKIAETLSQKYIYMPSTAKDYFFINFLTKFDNISTIIFCNTCREVHTLSYILNSLGFQNVSLHSF